MSCRNFVTHCFNCSTTLLIILFRLPIGIPNPLLLSFWPLDSSSFLSSVTSPVPSSVDSPYSLKLNMLLLFLLFFTLIVPGDLGIHWDAGGNDGNTLSSSTSWFLFSQPVPFRMSAYFWVEWNGGLKSHFWLLILWPGVSRDSCWKDSWL